ncbi:hypothetical protein Ancab_031715 [Ancistrocladus abbreviatus]
MKGNCCGSALLVFLVFLIVFSSSSLASARLLPAISELKKADDANGDGITSPAAVSEDDIPNLMGSEKCEKEDEECLKRRIMADAHLDYIYTQRDIRP